MSKLTKELHEVQVMNSHGFYAEKGQVFIAYQPGESGRLYRSPRWKVNRVGYKTDPNAHFSDHETKTFLVIGGGKYAQVKAEKLEEVKAWAKEQYGVQHWHRDPFGSYGEETYVKARLKALKAKIKQLPFRVGDSVIVNGEGPPRIVDGIYVEDRNHLKGDPSGYRAVYYKASEFTKVEPCQHEFVDSNDPGEAETNVSACIHCGQERD